METLIQKSARQEFALRAEISAELRHRLMMEMNARLRAEQSNAQKEKQRRQDAEFIAAMETVLAPRHKIEEFTIKLDRNDTATVQALMDNERDTIAVRKEIDAMLLKAHTLPDGRRVFKTESGTQVFDEFGAEIAAEQVAPTDIDDKAPKWEQYNAAGMERDRLASERKSLLDYQAKLDVTRERISDPALTENELSALDKELGQSMPDRVRKLTGEPAQAGPDAKVTATSALDAPRQEPRNSPPPANVMQPL